MNGDVGDPVGAVNVTHGADHDRWGQVTREAGIADQRDFEAKNPPLVVVANFVVKLKGVTATGNQDVVVTVKAQFDRPLAALRGDGRNRGNEVGFGFLAAETTPQTPALDRKSVV